MGAYADDEDRNRGFLRHHDGGYTTLDVPGGTGTAAYAINASGQIVGWYWYDGFIYHGFLATPK